MTVGGGSAHLPPNRANDHIDPDQLVVHTLRRREDDPLPGFRPGAM